MKVLGIVAEYNPFHNGHLYHLKEARRLSGADFVIAVMSGNFIQRGEPAIINKWARTKAALESGIDLIIELPAVYAISSAEFFAFGAVKLLDSLGVVDHLCFGSEIGSLSDLYCIAEILYNEPPSYKNYLKENLSQGISFPSARSEALKQYFHTQKERIEDLPSLLASSNNILGVEYLKALLKLKSSITPLSLPRVSNRYNEETLTGNISSATAIRKNILSQDGKISLELENSLPHSSIKILKEEFAARRGPVAAHHFENIILSILRNSKPEKLKNLPYVAEGLENRILRAAHASGSYEELLESINTKRYTRTRLQRILFNLLLGVTSNDFKAFQQFGGPQYVRVLGFSSQGRSLLSQINKLSTLPLIVKPVGLKNSCNPLLRRMLEIEAQATDLYVLAYSNALYRKGGQEFTENIVLHRV